MNSGNCQLKQHYYSKITNTGFFALDRGNGSSILVDGSSTIDNFINYGQIETYISLSGTINHLTNYGTMEGISVPVQSHTNHIVTIENYGTINPFHNDKYHFNRVTLLLQAYAMTIDEKASDFNAFDGNAKDNSHLVLKESKGVSFADKNSKLILDFGSGFELGKGYSLSKLVVDTSGASQMSVDLAHLTTRTSLYKLTQSGEHFIATIDAPNSEIGILHKANVRTMNNFYTLSNSLIFPRKSQNLGKKNQLQVDSAISLKSYESFSYRSEAQNRRIQRQNKRNYSRQRAANTTRESILDEKSGLRSHEQGDRTRSSSTKRVASLHDLSPKDNARDYYFILTPFINYNSFAKSGNYNLSGFDYGFLTAFSGKLTQNNSLGAHFMMSYGSLGNSTDKNFSITNLNLNVGLNYKFDLVWDMYLKARGDFFYFLNQVKTLTMIEAIKPNNMGFGVSVAYGKDFDFKEGGVLGLEVGLDYKAMQSSTISLQNNASKSISETYNKALYNLLYADLGINYNKYFGSFGINATLGIRGNITANKLAKSKIYLSSFNKSVDMVLDNDNFLGYANLGASYVLQTKNFDMEFSLAYYGNFGDRVISNGGGVEWRVMF